MSHGRRSRGTRPLPRVDVRDTAVAPLPARFPRARLWLLLGVVVLLAMAAMLSVVRL